MHSMSTQDYLIILIFAFFFNLSNGILSVVILRKSNPSSVVFKCIVGIVLSLLLEIMLFILCVLDLSKKIPPIESSKQRPHLP